jgi:hypothetical protein
VRDRPDAAHLSPAEPCAIGGSVRAAELEPDSNPAARVSQPVADGITVAVSGARTQRLANAWACSER